MSGSDATFDVYCKGAPTGGNPSLKGTLLDCPFSQWVMLTLEEKGISYRKQLCDEENLPEFLGEKHPAGKPLIPVVHDLKADKWIGESKDIVKYIEMRGSEHEKFPEPKLGTPDSTSDAGESLFPDAFLSFLTSEDGSAEEAQAKEKLLQDYKALDTAFGKKGGPYLGGKEPNSQDLALAPRLHHISIATYLLKGFPIPEDFREINAFLLAVKDRASWAPTAPASEKYVEEGWRKKVASIRQSS